jgi:hypothetical protein
MIDTDMGSKLEGEVCFEIPCCRKRAVQGAMAPIRPSTFNPLGW